MVLNISMAKEHNYDYIENEVKLVKEGYKGTLFKVILETCLLIDEEIIECSKVSVRGKADYIKTSTGFFNKRSNCSCCGINEKSCLSKYW